MFNKKSGKEGCKKQVISGGNDNGRDFGVPSGVGGEGRPYETSLTIVRNNA